MRVVWMAVGAVVVLCGVAHARDTVIVTPGMPNSEVRRALAPRMPEIQRANPDKVKLRAGGNPRNDSDYIVETGELVSPDYTEADMRAEHKAQAQLADKEISLEYQLDALGISYQRLRTRHMRLARRLVLRTQVRDRVAKKLNAAKTRERHQTQVASLMLLPLALLLAGVVTLWVRLRRSMLWGKAMEAEKNQAEARAVRIKSEADETLRRWRNVKKPEEASTTNGPPHKVALLGTGRQ